MGFIKAGLSLILLSASSLVVATKDVPESEQWAMVVLGLFLVVIQVTRVKRAAEPLGLDNEGAHEAQQ